MASGATAYAPERCTRRPPKVQPWHAVCPSGEQRDTGHAPCVAHTLCSRRMHTVPATATALAHGVPLGRTVRHRARTMRRPYTVLQRAAHNARHSCSPGTRCAPQENSATQGTHHASPIHCAPDRCTQCPPQLRPWHTVCPSGEQHTARTVPSTLHTNFAHRAHLYNKSSKH